MAAIRVAAVGNGGSAGECRAGRDVAEASADEAREGEHQTARRVCWAEARWRPVGSDGSNRMEGERWGRPEVANEKKILCMRGFV